MTERCDWSELPRDQCAHCGAHPGDRPVLEPAIIGTRRVTRLELPTPADPGPPLKLTYPGQNLGTICACGQPTRDHLYGCDDCTGELHRFLGDVPWLVDQLDSSITRQRAKTPGNSTKGGESLPWLERAAVAQRRITGLLDHTVRLCERVHVPHQSPHIGPPKDGPVAASRWLLWRVDGLPRINLFPDILRATMTTERAIYRVIDCAPDLLYLGLCTRDDDDRGRCNGAVYAIAGEDTGKCRACRASYLTEPARRQLYTDLDGRLCTAAEIARLSTYLGIPADRDRVRNLVNQWHHRGRLANHGREGTAPLFRYGEVVALLAAKYDDDERKEA